MQAKINKRHMNLVEFMQFYTFVLNHKLGKTNRVENALSRRVALLGITVVKLIGLESMKVDYDVDEDFVDAWRASKEAWSFEREPYLDYFIQEGYFFKGNQLCIPRE